MSALKTLMARLTETTGQPAEWWNTGGGCMTVRVATQDGGEILVGDREDSFGHSDLESDANLSGFAAYYYAPGYQESHDDVVHIYTSPERVGPEEPTEAGTAYEDWERDEAVHRASWLTWEAYQTAAAVLAHKVTIRPEPRIGMIGKQIITVTSRELVGRDTFKDYVTFTETTVTTWAQECGYETHTFTETNTDLFSEGKPYANFNDDGHPVDADGNEVTW